MKIATVVGARPQFIKAFTISKALVAHPKMNEVMVHTGQHFDANMSAVFFEEMGIPKPKYNLDIHSGTHGKMTGRMLEALEAVFLEERPNLVLVYGDTNSTLAAALAASKLNIPVAHIEAGLRSFNRTMPEEINRVLTDHVSTFLFAPTNTAVENLKKEGISGSKVYNVGDVMFDAALAFSTANELVVGKLMERYYINKKQYGLVTFHRAENTKDIKTLEAVVECLNYAATQLKLILPLHPRAKLSLEKAKLLQRLDPSIQLIDPVGYKEMVLLEKNAKIILTDSGGVQKEAFFHQVPCITMREETEWVELVDGGWNKLTGVSLPRFQAALAHFSGQPIPQFNACLYGSGQSAARILEILESQLVS